MKSRVPKVLHTVLGRSMLGHVLATTEQAGIAHTVVVSDPISAPQIATAVSATVAIQELPLGTADAVAVGVEALPDNCGDVLVLNGDVPLVQASTLRLLTAHHQEAGATITIGTFQAPGDARYGRVERTDGRITRIREAADDQADRSAGFEANGGVYCFDRVWLEKMIGAVHVSRSGEYYVTNLIEMAAREENRKARIESVALDESELLGVDDRQRLAQAEALLRRRINARHLMAGVTIVDPERTVIEADVRIAPDVRIEPGCILRGATIVGEGTVVGPYSVIEDSTIGRDCVIMQSWISGADIADRVRVGPFSRLRPGTMVASDVFIGNFVETKATEIGEGSDVHHVTYLGDAILGANVNIGAGTITCNYDGVAKHKTIIGDDVFVGCDTMLVAPVELGARSRTGAGAVVTRSVPAGKTVVGVPARELPRRQQPKLREEHGR